MFPNGSRAVIVTGCVTPARTGPAVGIAIESVAAPVGAMLTPAPTPRTEPLTVSAAATDWTPAVLNVAVKVWTPASAAVNVYGAGRTACGSVPVNATVPT